MFNGLEEDTFCETPKPLLIGTKALEKDEHATNSSALEANFIFQSDSLRKEVVKVMKKREDDDDVERNLFVDCWPSSIRICEIHRRGL